MKINRLKFEDYFPLGRSIFRANYVGFREVKQVDHGYDCHAVVFPPAMATSGSAMSLKWPLMMSSLVRSWGILTFFWAPGGYVRVFFQDPALGGSSQSVCGYRSGPHLETNKTGHLEAVPCYPTERRRSNDHHGLI